MINRTQNKISRLMYKNLEYKIANYYYFNKKEILCTHLMPIWNLKHIYKKILNEKLYMGIS